MQADTPREIYNILLLGDQYSGKTRFFNELCETQGEPKKTFIKKDHQYLITTNIELCAFNYNIHESNLRIQLWDTPSSSAYHHIISRFMTKPFFMIIIMFTNDTFYKIPNWVEFINAQQLSYTPIIMLMENDTESSKHSPDTIIEKYPYLKYSINLYGQSSYILKTIIEELMIIKTHTSSICCKDRKNNRCCF